jgi:peptidoglycan/xylan/chitin deacetylase (PgdA/CDA1 family)
MNTDKIVCRSDDYDLRLEPAQYIAVHEEFKKAGLIETANMQFTQWGRLCNVPEEIVNYINANKDSFSIQIHGWGHFAYDEMEYDFIVRDLAACQHFIRKYFNTQATVWYPPWNRFSNTMEKAANYMGLKLDNESNDIAKFIREVETELARGGKWSGHSVYFHSWKQDEMIQFPKMIELLKKLNESSIVS